MDEPTAEARAAQFLETFVQAGTTVALDRQEPPLRRSWCYVFFWNTQKYLATRHPFDAMAGNGPIVVPSDGSAPFRLPTYAPEDELLDEYERKHGLTRL